MEDIVDTKGIEKSEPIEITDSEGQRKGGDQRVVGN